jgi:hypothetical protein
MEAGLRVCSSRGCEHLDLQSKNRRVLSYEPGEEKRGGALDSFSEREQLMVCGPRFFGDWFSPDTIKHTLNPKP